MMLYDLIITIFTQISITFKTLANQMPNSSEFSLNPHTYVPCTSNSARHSNSTGGGGRNKQEWANIVFQFVNKFIPFPKSSLSDEIVCVSCKALQMLYIVRLYQ